MYPEVQESPLTTMLQVEVVVVGASSFFSRTTVLRQLAPSTLPAGWVARRVALVALVVVVVVAAVALAGQVVPLLLTMASLAALESFSQAAALSNFFLT
jgi:hypothetical protein